MKEPLAWLMYDVHRATRKGLFGLLKRQKRRFAEMVKFARAASPYYEELYRDLPLDIATPELLPVTSKKALMKRFDDWGTDRQVSLADVLSLVRDATRIGERHLGRYTIVTTSGTTGTPGIFVMDDRSFAVTTAVSTRMLRGWLKPRDVTRLVARRGRMSMVMATHGHFASAVAAARLTKYGRGDRLQVLSSRTAMSELVAKLNEFRPAILAPYASVGALLAKEQESGRLRIEPALVALSAEGLPADDYARIARAFNAPVGNSYACTECPFLSYSCKHGWLHVNSDWVLLEPVDANYRPTRPGQESHTVLVTNLANRVQPVIRYDLGDRVLQREDPCQCGNPLPAIRVRGRTGEVLLFVNKRGESVAVPPLALQVDHIPGVELLQIVQATAGRLRIRLRADSSADHTHVQQAVVREILRVLEQLELHDVAVESTNEPPEQSASGKFRAVIPLGAHVS